MCVFVFLINSFMCQVGYKIIMFMQVVLRRRDRTVDFHEGSFWTEYENGFGDMSGEFWFGNYC